MRQHFCLGPFSHTVILECDILVFATKYETRSNVFTLISDFPFTKPERTANYLQSPHQNSFY